MNSDIFNGQFKQLRGSLQKTWGKITGDQWDQINGDFDKFLGSVQTAYGVTRDEAELQFRKWNDERDSTTNSSSSTSTAA